MKIELNPENTEVLDTTESDRFIYQKVKFNSADINATATVRTSKIDGTKTEICLDDFLMKSGLKLKDSGKDYMSEFFKNPVAYLYLTRNKIYKDDSDGRYYMNPPTLYEMWNLILRLPKGNQLDYQVTAPGQLTIKGLLNVSAGAILGGFIIDNIRFQSLADTNGIPNILLNGTDGSGHLAAGNILWDSLGNLLISGAFESNKSGNRVIIEPQGVIKMINQADEEIMTINTKSETPYLNFKYKELDVENEVTLSSSGLEIISNGYLIFSINSKYGEMFINPNKIPTSSDNLIPGSITKSLSTHCGRHTYATLLLTKGVSVESVSKMLGHTDIKTTQIYAKILHQKVDDEMNLVKNELNQMKYLYQ